MPTKYFVFQDRKNRQQYHNVAVEEADIPDFVSRSMAEGFQPLPADRWLTSSGESFVVPQSKEKEFIKLQSAYGKLPASFDDDPTLDVPTRQGSAQWKRLHVPEGVDELTLPELTQEDIISKGLFRESDQFKFDQLQKDIAGFVPSPSLLDKAKESLTGLSTGVRQTVDRGVDVIRGKEVEPRAVADVTEAPAPTGELGVFESVSRRVRGEAFGRDDDNAFLGTLRYLSPLERGKKRLQISDAMQRLTAGLPKGTPVGEEPPQVAFERYKAGVTLDTVLDAAVAGRIDLIDVQAFKDESDSPEAQASRDAIIQTMQAADIQTVAKLQKFEQEVEDRGQSLLARGVVGALDMIPYMMQIATGEAGVIAEGLTQLQERKGGAGFVDEDGDFIVTDAGADGFEAVTKSALSATGEYLIEKKLGGLFKGTVGKLFKGTKPAKLVTNLAKNLKGKIPMSKALERAAKAVGFDSLIEEIIVEEGAQAVYDATFNLNNQTDKDGEPLAFVDRQAQALDSYVRTLPEMAISFGLFGIGGGAVNLAAHKSNRRKQRQQLADAGVPPNQIDEIQAENDPKARGKKLFSAMREAKTRGAKAGITESIDAAVPTGEVQTKENQNIAGTETVGAANSFDSLEEASKGKQKFSKKQFAKGFKSARQLEVGDQVTLSDGVVATLDKKTGKKDAVYHFDVNGETAKVKQSTVAFGFVSKQLAKAEAVVAEKVAPKDSVFVLSSNKATKEVAIHQVPKSKVNDFRNELTRDTNVTVQELPQSPATVTAEQVTAEVGKTFKGVTFNKSEEIDDAKEEKGKLSRPADKGRKERASSRTPKEGRAVQDVPAPAAREIAPEFKGIRKPALKTLAKKAGVKVESSDTAKIIARKLTDVKGETKADVRSKALDAVKKDASEASDEDVPPRVKREIAGIKLMDDSQLTEEHQEWDEKASALGFTLILLDGTGVVNGTHGVVDGEPVIYWDKNSDFGKWGLAETVLHEMAEAEGKVKFAIAELVDENSPATQLYRAKHLKAMPAASWALTKKELAANFVTGTEKHYGAKLAEAFKAGELDNAIRLANALRNKWSEALISRGLKGFDLIPVSDKTTTPVEEPVKEAKEKVKALDKPRRKLSEIREEARKKSPAKEEKAVTFDVPENRTDVNQMSAKQLEAFVRSRIDVDTKGMGKAAWKKLALDQIGVAVEETAPTPKKRDVEGMSEDQMITFLRDSAAIELPADTPREVLEKLMSDLDAMDFSLRVSDDVDVLDKELTIPEGATKVEARSIVVDAMEGSLADRVGLDGVDSEALKQARVRKDLGKPVKTAMNKADSGFSINGQEFSVRQMLFLENKENQTKDQMLVHFDQTYGTDQWLKSRIGSEKTELNTLQWLLTRTSTYRNYFGDWAIESYEGGKWAMSPYLLNPRTGEPMVMVHGTPNGKLAFFDPKLIGTTSDKGWYGMGTYFAPAIQREGAIDVAASYAKAGLGASPTVDTYFINARNVLPVVDDVDGLQLTVNVAEELHTAKEAREQPDLAERQRLLEVFRTTINMLEDAKAGNDATSEQQELVDEYLPRANEWIDTLMWEKQTQETPTDGFIIHNGNLPVDVAEADSWNAGSDMLKVSTFLTQPASVTEFLREKQYDGVAIYADADAREMKEFNSLYTHRIKNANRNYSLINMHKLATFNNIEEKAVLDFSLSSPEYDKRHGLLGRAWLSMRARLELIHPRLTALFTAFDIASNDHTFGEIKKLEPFFNEWKKLSRKDKKAVDLLYLQKGTAVDGLEKFFSPEAFKLVKDFITQRYQEVIDSGRDIGFIEDYLPRLVKDMKGLMKLSEKKFGIPASRIKRALRDYSNEHKGGLPLNEYEQALVIQDFLSQELGAGKSLQSGVKNYQKRTIETVSPDQAKFYHSLPEALTRYIYATGNDLAKRSALTAFSPSYKQAVRAASSKAHRLASIRAQIKKTTDPTGLKNLTDIYGVIKQELDMLNDTLRMEIERHPTDGGMPMLMQVLENTGEIDPDNIPEIADMIRLMMNPISYSTVESVADYIVYTGNLAQFRGTLMNIGDFAKMFGRYSFGNAVVSTLSALSGQFGIGRAKVHKLAKSNFFVDIGTQLDMDKSRAYFELSSAKIFDGAAKWAYALTGWTFIVDAGTSAIAEGKLREVAKLVKRARKGDLKAGQELARELERTFIDLPTLDELSQSFESKEFNDVKKKLAYRGLADMIGISRSERTEFEARSPWLRQPYKFKKYLIKAYENVRLLGWNNVVEGTKAENPYQVAQGLRVMFGMLPSMWLGAVGLRLLLELIRTGFDEEEWEKTIPDVMKSELMNIFSSGIANRYAISTLQREGKFSNVVMSLINPALGMMQDMFIDVADVYHDKKKLRDMKTWRIIPIIGDPYHNGLGYANASRRRNPESVKRLRDEITTPAGIGFSGRMFGTGADNIQKLQQEIQRLHNIIPLHEKLMSDLGVEDSALVDRLNILTDRLRRVGGKFEAQYVGNERLKDGLAKKLEARQRKKGLLD